MAATAQGFSKLVAAGTTAAPFDPIDAIGNNGLEKCQGFWLVNTDPTNIAYMHPNIAATVNGDDTVVLLPRQWVWVAKPAYAKKASPTATTSWSFIAATAACNVMVVSDTGSWHPTD